ncbi:MAG TPA: thioredoxin family protein, partial [Kofleriaceae bacterium]
MGIRTRMVVVGLVCMVTSVHAESPPPLDEAIKQAAAARKPLLIEFGAQWCAPCKEFEARTLPSPSVKEALKGVVFVRYDADDNVGERAARKLGISSYPTFLVLDASGTEVVRQ